MPTAASTNPICDPDPQHDQPGKPSMDKTPFVIDEAPRQTIDASWSTKKKALVAGLSLAATAGAVLGGLSLWTLNSPPPRPTTAAEAVAFIQSGRYERLDTDRRRGYARDAANLLRDLTDEEREAILADEDLREKLGDVRRDIWDDMVLRWAQGEELNNPFRGMRPRGGNRTDGNGAGGNGEGEERQRPDMNAVRDMIRGRLSEQAASGNAQMSGLRSEMMMQRRATSGNQGWGGRGRGRGQGRNGGQGGGNR